MTREDDDRRPDPDALILAAAREGKGRLKIFLGMAPGVGKTWEMLAAGRRKRDEGIDVVVGLVETHGRGETAAQIGELPVLPRRRLAYRGREIEEFDLDGALARRPALLLLDELAHTNVPGSRHAKRWEDAAELLEAGIDVWSTLNIQHLESLNDAIARITGVRVAETIPDRVLALAADIEVIDLPPAELRARLAEGRVYPPETARRALGGFFREGNLAALREMALRRVAQHVDADIVSYMRAKAIAGPWPVGERVLALITPDAKGGGSDAEAVIRHAARLAEALRAPWLVLHIERPGGLADMRTVLSLAEQLGAEIETITGTDVIALALAAARQHNVTQIVIGRDGPSPWRWLTGRGLSQRLVRHAEAFAVHVIARPVGPTRPKLRRPDLPAGVWPWLVSALLVAAVILIGELVAAIPQEAMGMLFLAAVVVAASLHGLRVALFAAALGFLSWNLFFIPPLYVLTISDAKDVIGVFVFLIVAAVTGAMASRVRAEAQAAQSRIESLRRIGGFSRALGGARTEAELLAELARQGAGLAGQALVLMAGEGGDLAVRATVPAGTTLDEAAEAAARWTLTRGEPAGAGTATLPGSAWRFQPLTTARGTLGVIGVAGEARLAAPALQALAALADLGAVALERLRLAGEAARSAAQSETQRLRTALLSSLSHDLRTPLTAIRGAAETLRTAWDHLEPATRADLLGSIEQDTTRMHRFLTNITDMTRLESGEIVPRLVATDLTEVVEGAIARLDDGLLISVNIPPAVPPVLADPVLLEQVLANILGNALKYAPANSFTSVVARQEGDEVALRVTDEGVGIAAEDLPHIFDSFYRARRGDRVAPGTGLGLAIARGFVEAMGGHIAAASPRPDAPPDGFPGTVITLRLPSVAPQAGAPQ